MLTDLACKNLIRLAQKNKTILKKADAEGLYLLAQPNGRAYWRHKYYYLGKEQLISYGRYPLVSLSDARQKRDASYKLLDQGINPSKARKDEAKQAARQADNTFKAVALAWYNHNLSNWSKTYAYKIMLCMKSNLLPHIGTIPVTDLTRRQFLETLQVAEKREAFYTAKRVLQIILGVMTYAQDHEYITVNPALGLNRSLKQFKRGHFPSLEVDMLPDFITRLDKNEAGLSQDVMDALELLLLTMVRPSELREAEWPEFDFDKAMWTIPPERMKMGNAHLVPLSSRAIAILKRRKAANDLDVWRENGKYVFPSRIKPASPIHETTLTNALVRMGYKGIHCPHGFRALAMGIAKEKLDYSHEIPDRQLSHTAKGSVNRAYDRAKFLPKRIEMMDRLAAHVESLRRPVLKKWSFKVERQSNSFQPMPLPYQIHTSMISV